MKAHQTIRHAVRRALWAAAAASVVPAVPAFADEPGSKNPEQVSEVVVTGTRVRLRDFEAISPVTTVSADTIRATGQLSVEDVLNKLPQIVPGLNSNSNNPA